MAYQNRLVHTEAEAEHSLLLLEVLICLGHTPSPHILCIVRYDKVLSFWIDVAFIKKK